MKQLLPLFALLVVCCQHNSETVETRIHSIENTSCKVVETHYYTTIDYNGEDIIGEEIKTFDYRPNKEYYDKHDRLCLRTDLGLDASGEERYTLTTYLPKSDLEKITSIVTYYTDYSIGKKTDYIRNSKGEIEEIIDFDGDDLISAERFYEIVDGKPWITKKIQGTTIKTYSRMPSESNLVILSYKERNTDNTEVTEGVIGLTAKGTQVFDSEGNLKHSEEYNYKYGRVQEITIEDNYYDLEDRLLKCIVKTKHRGLYFSVPPGLAPNTPEYDDYIISHYYNSAEPQYLRISTYEYTYDNYGNQTSYKYTVKDNFDPYSDYRGRFISWKYEYNDKGDWTKCIIEDNRSIPSTIIAIRTITY